MGTHRWCVDAEHGSLIAYLSSETSGPSELYVQPFSSGMTRLQVSNGGASAGRWSHDGRTLYYWDRRGELMAASIQVNPTLAVISTREIGGHNELPGCRPNSSLFDVTPDGRVLVAEDIPGSLQMILVRNWTAGLAQSAKQ
jgi:Tol biopolymer transport system component